MTTATAADIRTAFLALTKIYHPARFGRMSSEIQKLANEVFLGLRGAHDSLQILGGRTPTAPGISALRPSTPPNLSAIPRPVAPQRETTRPMPILSSTTAMGTGAIPTTRPGIGLPRSAQTDPLRPPARPTEPMGKPPAVDPRAPRSTRPGTPAGGPTTTDKGFPRVDTQPGVTARPLRTDRLEHRLDPSTTMPPAPSVAVALDLVANRQWDAARVALSALSAMAPESQHVRALVCYAAGRQAQLEQRFDEARVDLQRALQLDPDLAPAKAALKELFVRRR
ncbi:MAG: hypothetical protein NT062_28325 [Proteobacteria bacterium]|nr:hypothetical protein [Pseudomonadota bacterium]